MEELDMRHREPFASGRHLAAARTLAGLKQIELAELAGLHVNSLKRLEGLEKLGSGWAVERVYQALLAQGIGCQTRPIPGVFVVS